MKNGKPTKQELAFAREIQAVMKKHGVTLECVEVAPHNIDGLLFTGPSISFFPLFLVSE
jgi:hypothetical protein